MTYMRPELLATAGALEAICGSMKGIPIVLDGDPDWTDNAAYEVDE